LRDLTSFQEGRTKVSSFEVGEEEVRLPESLRNLKVSSDQLGTLIEEEYQRNIIIIVGIEIFLAHSAIEASVCTACEEVMQQASEEEAVGPNVCEDKNLCSANAAEQRQQKMTVIKEENEQTLKSSQHMRE
jgi:hypothetical protein